MEENSKSMKVVFVGDTTVGKTSVINSMLGNEFEPKEFSPTIGIEYKELSRSYNGQKILLNLHDTAGQESYRNLIPFSLREASVILIFFDITNPGTFDNVDNWNETINSTVKTSVVKILVGNKNDLRSEDSISDELINEKAIKIGAITHFCTSALTGESISELIDFIVGNDEINKAVSDNFNEGFLPDQRTEKQDNCC